MQQEHTDRLAQESRERLKVAAADVAAKRAATKARVAAQRAAEQRLIVVARDTQIALKAQAAARRAGRAG